MAGQTRFPTFSTKRYSRPRHGKSWSDLWTISASRWQAEPVVMAAAGTPATRRRSASRSVSRSPAIAPSRLRPASARAVASSTAVLPAPGEPMRFTAKTPPSTKCSRLCAAVLSLTDRILSWTSTETLLGSPQPQVSHIGSPPLDSGHFHLDLLQDDLVARHEPRRDPAGRAAQHRPRRDRARALRARPGGLGAP